MRAFGLDLFSISLMTYIQDGLCSSTVHAKVLLAQLCDGRTLQCCGATWRLPPLAELTYLDLHFGYLLPWIHAGPWGILKNFWKHLLRDYTGRDAPPLCIPNRVRKIMSERAKYLVLTSDMGRPYTDIVRYKVTWVMENWLHWTLRRFLL